MLCRPCSSSSETHDEASDAITNAQVTAIISEDIASNKAQAPVQPTVQFPTSMFGKSSSSFQAKWYTDHKWLEYSKQKDAAFCFACRFFSSAAEAAFTEIGFRDWKHACGKDGILTCHAKSKPYKAAMLNWEEYQKRAGTDTTISLQFDRMGQQVIAENRQYVVAIMEAILYCAQQGIPLRGHDEGDDASNPGNFKSLMRLLSRHSLILKKRVQEGAKNATWLSPGIQNEILQFLANTVRQYIREELHEAKYYIILADKSRDISKKEQLSIAFRYTHKGKTVERFTEYTHASELNAPALAKYIFERISEFQLDLSNCVSVMMVPLS